jgi:branched-chain amino acid aminotransferase
MNIFLIVKCDDGGMLFNATRKSKDHWVSLDLDVDIITPPVDGTILPVVTRSSCLALTTAHSHIMSLPYTMPPHIWVHHHNAWSYDVVGWWQVTGSLWNWYHHPHSTYQLNGKDITLQKHESGMGPVGQSFLERLLEIHRGIVEWAGWSLSCKWREEKCLYTNRTTALASTTCVIYYIY